MTEQEIKDTLIKAQEGFKTYDTLSEKVADHFRAIIVPMLKSGDFETPYEILLDFNNESIHKFDLLCLIREYKKNAQEECNLFNVDTLNRVETNKTIIK